MFKQFLFLLLFATSCELYALVDFYGYRAYRPDKDSVDRYAQTLLGYSELELVEVTIVPRGVYLDVTEDAWISSDVNKLNIKGLTDNYLFKGSIPIPQTAVVTGLQTWRGDKLYRTFLHPSKYIVDTHYDDSASLQKSLDSRIALLQQHTETHFEITLARVALGERIHVRIRYLLRPENSAIGYFAVPILFHTEQGKRPAFIQCTIKANDADQVFALQSTTGTIMVNDTTTKLLPYEPSFILRHRSASNATMNISEMTSGPYTGHYVAVNSGITDSIVSQLSKPIATVFVWRWNGPERFTTTSDGIRSLSTYSKNIIEQATLLRETIADLQRLGNSCALIHSIEGNASFPFISKQINSLTDSSALSYLASMNEMDLFARYKNETDTVPDWVVKENGTETIIQKERETFLSVLDAAQHLLNSNGSETFKHIVLLSAGDANTRYRKDLHEALSLKQDSITIDNHQALWRGVDCQSTLPVSSLFSWSNFSFPAFSPILIELSVKNAQQPFAFPLKKNAWSSAVVFTARTSARWDTTISWTGIDAHGVATRTITCTPQLYRHHADSGLAKLWAGDRSHIADVEEMYPGGTFGILTKSTFLQATSANVAHSESETVPYLSDDEILAPRTAVQQKNAKVQQATPSIKIINSDMFIATSINLTSLKIFDCKGRLLLQINPADFRSSSGNYFIPLARLLKQRHLNLLVIQLKGDGISSTYTLINGRIR